MNSVQVEGLRALHVPAEPSWWPPAPGWWILTFALLTLCLWLVWFIHKLRMQRRWKREALSEYRRITALPGHTDELRVQQLQLCSLLLRRISLALCTRTDVAGTTGEQWLGQLDALSDTSAFTKGVGRLVADAPYRAHAISESDMRALFALVNSTIRRAKRRQEA